MLKLHGIYADIFRFIMTGYERDKVAFGSNNLTESLPHAERQMVKPIVNITPESDTLMRGTLSEVSN